MCGLGDFKGCVKEASDTILGQVAEQMADAAKKLLELVLTSWFDVPSPGLASSGGQVQTSAGVLSVISSITGSLEFITGFVAVLGMVVALGRMVWNMRIAPLRDIGRMLLIVAAASGAGTTTVLALLHAGDAFAASLVKDAFAGKISGEAAMTVFAVAEISTTAPGLGIIAGLVLILALIAQAAFMIVRGGMVIVMLCMLPTFSADTTSEEGMGRFKRFLGLLLAAVLYKPVAAVIYAAGVRLGLSGLGVSGTDDMMRLMYGITIIAFATLALPAMIKFFVPLAAAGTSSMFSGAAAVEGAAAVGAAVVTLGAAVTGAGAGAGAAGSGGAATSTGPQSPGGAPSTPPSGGTPTPGTSGGGSSGPGIGGAPPDAGPGGEKDIAPAPGGAPSDSTPTGPASTGSAATGANSTDPAPAAGAPTEPAPTEPAGADTVGGSSGAAAATSPSATGAAAAPDRSTSADTATRSSASGAGSAPDQSSSATVSSSSTAPQASQQAAGASQASAAKNGGPPPGPARGGHSQQTSGSPSGGHGSRSGTSVADAVTRGLDTARSAAADAREPFTDGPTGA